MHSIRPTSTSAVIGQSNAISAWAAVGAAFIVLQVYIFARWIGSPQFTPAPTGDAPLPAWTEFQIWLFQATFPLFILGGIAWFIWYLDEVVEARADTIVVLHPLMDHRRELHIDRRGESVRAPDSFMLVLSYNPGYQSLMKDLKPSTRQRMVAIDFDFPPATVELAVLTDLYGIDKAFAEQLVRLAQAIRRLDEEGLSEAASARSLVAAGKLHRGGLSTREAAVAAIASPLSDDAEVRSGLVALIDNYVA